MYIIRPEGRKKGKRKDVPFPFDLNYIQPRLHHLQKGKFGICFRFQGAELEAGRARSTLPTLRTNSLSRPCIARRQCYRAMRGHKESTASHRSSVIVNEKINSSPSSYRVGKAVGDKLFLGVASMDCLCILC